MISKGIPTVAQWVENPTAVAWVATEVQVQSPAHCSGLKDLALTQLWHRWHCGSDAIPGQGTSICYGFGH